MALIRERAMSERRALLNIAGKLDSKAVKAAQIAARKRLRAAATARRDELRAINEQITDELTAAIEESDADVLQQFRDGREHQVDCGVLAIAIAQQDANRLITN